MFDNEPSGLTEAEICSVEERANVLGLKPPEGLSILPRGFFLVKDVSELAYEPRRQDLKVLFRNAGLTLDGIEPDGVRIPFQEDRDSTLILPVLFIGATFWAQNPHLVSIALGVVSNYVTDWFKGRVGKSRVKFGVVVEKTDKKTTKRIDYDGPPEQFEKLLTAVEKTLK